MAELTKQALQVQNNTSFPNNNAGLITPTSLRTFNSDMIDSLVDEISYTADSASFNSRINSVTGSTTNTGSLLLTASFDNGTRNLTFTKGNNTTFAVNIPDASGSAGNFATTGSNTFVGDQTISGSVLPLVNGQGDLGNDSQRWNKVVVNGELKGSSINTTGRASVGSVRFVDEVLPLQFLAAREIVANGNGTYTHMYYGTGSNVEALREFVYAQSGSNADFTAVSASFNTRINNITGSGTINTGSFATTGSNAFIGNQTIAGGLIVSSSTQPISISGSSFIVDTFDGGGAITFRPGTSINFFGNTNFTSALRAPLVNVDNLAGGGYYGFNAETTGRIYQDFSGSVNSRINAIVTGTGFATTGSNTFVGDQTISASLFVSGNTNVGFLNIADAGGINLAGTGSIISSYGIVTNPSNGDLVFNTNPNNGRLMTFSATTGKMTQFNGLYFNAGDSNSVNGGIDFSTYSGSLFLTPSGFSSTTASMLHISSSSNINNVNLIFKNSNTAADTIISGSNNIFTNPAAPTAGFKRYMTGANIAVGGNGVAIPQISGSMAWSPIIANNVFAVSGTPLTFRGPVSSSQSLLNNNVLAGGAINLGTSATLNFEKASNGTNIAGNIVNGTVNATAYKTAFISSSTMAISSNSLGGQTTLNADSSSITLAGSTIQNANLRVDNSYYNVSATAGGNSLQIQLGNGIFGNATTIYASGSNTTAAVGRQFFSNIVAGTFNSASLNLNGDNSNIFATAIIGHGLNVTGSSALQTGAAARTNSYGSAFFGRFNAEDGNRNKTAETVLAVGTGNTTTSKTGFLIDSGSNTFIEGTLNVSGSTSMTGSLSIAPTFEVKFATGSNQQAGTAVLNAASPGTVVVSNSLVTANSIILVSKQTLAHPNGYVAVSAKSAGSFTITSNHNGDADTVGYFIINNS